MIAHRRGRVIVIAEDVEPYPGRARRLIKLPPRAGRPVVAVVSPPSVTEAAPCRTA